MKNSHTLLVTLTLAACVPVGSWAQTTSLSSQEQAPVTRNAEGRAAARIEQPGEQYPLPSREFKPKPSAGERVAARTVRKVKGAQAAKETKLGEGDGIPAQTAKVPRAERLAARTTRHAEAVRANKAGEIKSKGESSY